MAIGQAGSITTNSPGENDPISITFDEPLSNPVFALTATNNGGNQFTLRVTDIQHDTNGDATGFTFIMEEWEYHDGPHPATETINWLAIEEGVHTLPDGRVIEAGTTSATDATSPVSLNGGFTDPPVVMTSVMSENDTTTVDSDPLNVTASGFDMSLQEEEAQDGAHAAETVGYIAVEAGGDAASGTAGAFGGVDENTETLPLGDTFADPVAVAETQTINGGNTATVVIDGQTNSDVGVFIEEEQSQDAEMNHANEDVGVVTFEDGLILCFTPGTLIDTVAGPREITTLRPGDLVLTEDDGPQPLRWISRTVMDPARLNRCPHLRPLVIRKGALAPGLPTRDMMVSPQHRMLITGWKAELLHGAAEVLVPAKSLRDACQVVPAPWQDGVCYYHLLFDRHQIVTANGTPSESLHAGELDKSALDPAARADLLALFPDLAWLGAGFGPLARPSVSMHDGRAFARDPRAGFAIARRAA